MEKEAPGHTDLMVTPEEIDSFLEANPPPIEENVVTTAGSCYTTLQPVQAKTFVIGNVVSIDLQTGQVTRLAGWTSDDEAAESFWRAVSAYFPRAR